MSDNLDNKTSEDKPMIGDVRANAYGIVFTLTYVNDKYIQAVRYDGQVYNWYNPSSYGLLLHRSKDFYDGIEYMKNITGELK